MSTGVKVAIASAAAGLITAGLAGTKTGRKLTKKAGRALSNAVESGKSIGKKVMRRGRAEMNEAADDVKRRAGRAAQSAMREVREYTGGMTSGGIGNASMGGAASSGKRGRVSGSQTYRTPTAMGHRRGR